MIWFLDFLGNLTIKGKGCRSMPMVRSAHQLATNSKRSQSVLSHSFGLLNLQRVPGDACAIAKRYAIGLLAARCLSFLKETERNHDPL